MGVNEPLNDPTLLLERKHRRRRCRSIDPIAILGACNPLGAEIHERALDHLHVFAYGTWRYMCAVRRLYFSNWKLASCRLLTSANPRPGSSFKLQ